MANPWGAWDDMPQLVDADGMGSQAQRTIPPPPGATIMPSGPPPHTAPTIMQQLPQWGTPFPHYTFPTPPDPYAAWRQWYNTTAYPQQSGPSPYISRQPMPRQPMPQQPMPHQPMPQQPMPQQPMPQQPMPHQPLHTGMQSRDHPRRPNPQPSARKRSQSFHVPIPWPSEGDLSPLELPAGMPDVQQFTPRALDMHTPSSSLSRSTSSGSSLPSARYHERPQQWRYDFKFKSGFASMFRSRSNSIRALDDVVDSAKLDLHPFLRYSKSRPIAIYDMRREPLTLMFRGLDRPPLATDMDHSVTRPATQYMRIYHPRLPWYIEIRANGAPYISLADFFQQLFAALNKPISRSDFYTNELDDEDRDVLTRAYLERCRTQDDKMEGVKKVDFLRGKSAWMGLIAGKNGMWRLKTAD